MADNILRLPAELIEVIGESLKVDDLLNLCKSSAIIATMCKNPQFWRNKIGHNNPHAQLENLTLPQLITLYRSMGYLYGFGENNEGQLGLPGVHARDKPVKIWGKTKVIQVSCGFKHTVAVTSDNKIWVVGDNSRGQLGLGDRNSRTTPTFIPNFDNVRQVSCGTYSTGFVTLDGALYIFGNIFYERAEGPIKVMALIHQKIVQISCGVSHMAVVDDQGNVYDWGSNSYGQLGLRDDDERIQPTPIKLGKKIKQVGCGYNFTVFLTVDGEVYTCGDGRRGQLGVGNVREIDYPQKISNLPPIDQVSCGRYHTLFLSITGEVYVCGDNTYSQLGLGESYEKNVLIPIKNNFLPPIKQVSGGNLHSAFISTEGTIYLCGHNFNGVLGLELPDEVISIPAPIPNITDAVYVSCGNEYTALIRS